MGVTCGLAGGIAMLRVMEVVRRIDEWCFFLFTFIFFNVRGDTFLRGQLHVGGPSIVVSIYVGGAREEHGLL